MVKSEGRHFIPMESENDSSMQCTPCRRKQRSAKSKSSPSNRKTPTPPKEYKILSRRSPNNLARSLQDEFGRTSPTRQSPTFVNSRTDDDDVQTVNISSIEITNASSYAGARFHSPPLPNTLPKPPTHWLNASCAATVDPMLNAPFLDSIAVHLKGLLNVQA